MKSKPKRYAIAHSSRVSVSLSKSIVTRVLMGFRETFGISYFITKMAEKNTTTAYSPRSSSPVDSVEFEPEGRTQREQFPLQQALLDMCGDPYETPYETPMQNRTDPNYQASSTRFDDKTPNSVSSQMKEEFQKLKKELEGERMMRAELEWKAKKAEKKAQEMEEVAEDSKKEKNRVEAEIRHMKEGEMSKNTRLYEQEERRQREMNNCSRMMQDNAHALQLATRKLEEAHYLLARKS